MTIQPTSWLQNLGIAIEVICPALSLIVVGLRVYIRLKTANFGWGKSRVHATRCNAC
jgi:hypothetical protein